MKFKIYKTSDYNNEKEIEIKSLEDLIKIVDEACDEIVDCFSYGGVLIYKGDHGYCIEIYDDYRE